jgi:cobalamin transport system substrate-binding protein
LSKEVLLRPVRALSALVLLAALAVSGCGDADGDGGRGDGGATPAQGVTVQAGNGAVKIPARPARIVSLSPSATEMLYAIGAGPQVVAVDDQSDFPQGAPRTTLSGFKPNAEAVIARKPDLVVLSNDINGIVSALQRVKIPVLLEGAPAKLEETYDQIADLGLATGHTREAQHVTTTMRQAISTAVQRASGATKKLSYYHELDEGLHTATSKTFIGQVYGMFGLTNVADPADRDSGGYPQLSREYLVKADPDMIFLADTQCCGQSTATVAKRPGWAELTAVRKRNVVELDDDIASRWGPRLADLVTTIGAAVQRAR